MTVFIKAGKSKTELELKDLGQNPDVELRRQKIYQDIKIQQENRSAERY